MDDYYLKYWIPKKCSGSDFKKYLNKIYKKKRNKKYKNGRF